MTDSPPPLDELPSRLESAIGALDEALGRPPFPNPADESVLCLARKVQTLTCMAKEKNRVPSLAQSKAVTTTLPILCAAIKDGSVGKTPCPTLTQLLLQALTPVCTLSTYPLQPILRDMQTCLPPQSVTLFEFTLASGALDVQRMRDFLGLPAQPPPSSSGAGSGGKAKRKKAGKEADSRPPAKVDCETATNVDGREAPSKELLTAMLAAALNDECRAEVVALFNTSAKFLKLVGSDGQLAERILDVYGHVLLPTLKPASLLACLDEHLLDYFVDMVQKHEDRMLLLTDRHLITSAPVTQWSTERLARLCRAAKERTVTQADGYGSLLSAVFLARASVERMTSTQDEKHGDLEDVLDNIWEAAFAAAWWTYLAECEGGRGNASQVEASSVECGARFASEESLELVGNVLQVRDREEEKWLRPLAILSDTTSHHALRLFHCVGAPPPRAFAKSSLVAQFMSRVVVPSLQGKSVEHRKHLLQSRVQTAAPQQRSAGAAPKAKAKSKDGKKGGEKGSRDGHTESTTGGTAATQPPLTYAMYLQLNARVVFLSVLLSSRVRDNRCWVVALSQAYLFCATFPTQQSMTGAMWDLFIDDLTLLGWQLLHRRKEDRDGHSTSGAESAETAASVCLVPVVNDGVVAATKAVSNPLWITPYLCRAIADMEAHGADAGATEWIDKFFSQPLVDALLNSFLLKRGAKDRVAADESDGEFQQRSLYPLRASVALGLLAHVLTSEGHRLSATINRFSKTDTIDAMLPYLDSILDAYLLQDNGASPPIGVSADLLPVSVSGIQRLRELLSLEHQLRQDESQRKTEAEAAERRARVLRKLEEDAALALDHARFEADQDAKLVIRQKEAEQVRQEYERRRQARERRTLGERQEREAKRQAALATLRTQMTRTKAEREADRVLRAQRYKERMASLFRVSVFLEHLQLVPSRAMEIRDQLAAALESISPDELLEFVVTGNRSIPEDMLTANQEEAPESETSTTGGDQLNQPTLTTTVAQQAQQQRSPETQNVVAVKDFWADVAREETSHVQTREHGSAFQGGATEGVRVTVGEGKRLEPRAAVEPALDPAEAPRQPHSFHYRVAPLLDLFCFAGGNEYGDLPTPMPALKLTLASKAVSVGELAAVGFHSVREAFLLMQARGLVTVDDGRAELTVLGFRYHFPYHDPERMLEVRMHRYRERVREAVTMKQATMGSHSGSDEDVVDDDSDSEDSEDPDRLLPDVEFGI